MNHDPNKCPNCLAQQVAQAALMLEIGKRLEKDFPRFAPGRKTKKRLSIIHDRNQFLWNELDFWLDRYGEAIINGDNDDRGSGGNDDAPDDNPEPPEDPGEEVELTAHQEMIADHHLDFLKVRISK